MTLPGLSLGLIVLLLGTTAHAATAEAWAGHDKSLLSKCQQASSLKHPKPAGSPALFDDSIGYTALLLKGTYPQKFMNNRSGIELCLYHRASQKAVVTEWDGVNSTSRAKQP